MPGYPAGVRSGTLGYPCPSRLLGHSKDYCLRACILRGDVTRISGGDTWGGAVPHLFQCGGILSGVSLDIVGGGRRGKAVRVGEGGVSPRLLF